VKFLILFLSLPALSFDDIERSQRESIILSAPTFKEIDELIEDLKPIQPENPYTLYKDPVEDSPVVKLLLKVNTRVTDPISKAEKIVPKDTFVSGKLIKKTGKYQIFDKKNQVAFEISGEDAILVDKTVDMDPLPKTYLTYGKTELNKPLAKKFSLTHSFSLNKQTIDATYFSQFFKNEATTADALKLDYKIFHKTDFPIALGLVASFEAGDYNNSGYSGLFFGAGVKTPLRISKDFLLEAHLIFERSLYLNVNSTSFSTYYFQGNLEAIFKDRYFLNLAYNGATFSADNQWINTPADSNTGSSFGIGIGMKFYSDIML
jgi:hypothetical protein